MATVNISSAGGNDMATTNDAMHGRIDMNNIAGINSTLGGRKMNNSSVMGGTNMTTNNISFLDGLDTEKRIGEFISKQRKAVEMTIEELSEISGVEESVIRNIESGAKDFNYNWLKILKFLNVELEEGVDLVDAAIKARVAKNLRQVDIQIATGLCKAATSRFESKTLEIPYDGPVFKLLIVLQKEYNLLSPTEKAIVHEEIEYDGKRLNNIIRTRRKEGKFSLERIESVTGLDADLILDIENGKKCLMNPNWYLILEFLGVKLSSSSNLVEEAIRKRHEMGMSVKEFSDASGISETVINRFERGLTKIPYKSPVFQLLALFEQVTEKDEIEIVERDSGKELTYAMCFWGENSIYRKRFTPSELNIVKAIFKTGTQEENDNENLTKCFLYLEDNVYSKSLTETELNCLLVLLK